jgi:chemotaxis regulatin CheY-phosphate phosphatase CheZ
MLKQFSALSLKDQAAMLKTLRGEYLVNRTNAKAMRQLDRDTKAQAKADRVAASIAKAQARLQKLLEKQAQPVGAKAIKANKRPSKGVVFGAEANELAAKIKAGVSTI